MVDGKLICVNDMSYTHSLKYRSSLNKEFLRFQIQLIFSFVLILFLLFCGFLWAFGFLLVLFIVSVLVYKFFRKKDNWLTRFIFEVEMEYEEGFPGKETAITLLGFLTVFVILYAMSYFVQFPVTWALVLGLVNMGFANNLAALILWKTKHQYIIFGTTMEFLLLSTALGFLIFFILGLPYYVAIFLSFVPNLFLIIPRLNHNLITLFVTSLLYIVLFI